MEITGNVAAVTGLDFKTTAEQIQRSMSAGISAADLFRDKGVKGILQLSQAFAVRKIQGDEFRSISENIPPLTGDNICKRIRNYFERNLKQFGSKIHSLK
jgi:hypothetical protein